MEASRRRTPRRSRAMPAMRRQAWALMAPGLTDEEWDAFIEALTED